MWDLQNTDIDNTVLIGIDSPVSEIPLEESLSELYQLARTAGAKVSGKVTQKREHPHPVYYFGTGKLKELKDFVLVNSLQLVIVDDELSPTQERNLEEELGCKVIDRTRLILDIFAIHASSGVGKLQVELAQMEYYLPRLKNIWTEFSKLGGGIGTRGPGEKKIDIDRRIISDRITAIKRKLRITAVQGRDRRKRRYESFKKNICLVGYTNSGKSTLMNVLTGAGVEVANKLFSTLSPTTRKLNCGKHDVLLTDTVGFIRKLPHQVVEAFMATLEQVKEADLLLHVIDISFENYRHQIEAVKNVLIELNAMDRPILRVYNKIDRTSFLPKIKESNPPSVFVSALKNDGIQELKNQIEKQLDEGISEVGFRVPQTRQDIINSIYENSCVIERKYVKNDVIIKCYLNRDLISAYRNYVIKNAK